MNVAGAGGVADALVPAHPAGTAAAVPAAAPVAAAQVREPEREGAVRDRVSGQEQAVGAREGPGQVHVYLRYHEPSQRWMVVFEDPSTGRVIDTVPPEALLDTIGRIRAMIGLLLDERT